MYAMIVVAAILGFVTVLSIFGSLRNVSDRISEIVVAELLPKDSALRSQEKDEWEDSSTKKEHRATDDEILTALLLSKDKKKATTE